MAERFLTLEEQLRSIAVEIEVPQTPPIAPSVIARLETERTIRRRPPFPGFALWPRRRVLALAAIAIAALLAIAAAARLSIGAIQIRVQPTRSSSVSPPPPESPVEFGEPVSLAAAEQRVAFRIDLPAGTAPDRAFLFRSPFGRASVILAWEPTASSPAIPGLPWGTMLTEMTGDEEVGLKTIGSLGELHDVDVGGSHGWWLTEPHDIFIETDVGTRTYRVSGNVLIWHAGTVTYRLETSLGLRDALRLAGSIG
jgi:hypothetical protein